VQNSFMNKRVTVNSKELLLHESNLMDTPQSQIGIGKNLARIRLNTTSSEANLPTLLYMALNALHEKARLGVIKITSESTTTIEEHT